MSRRSDRLAQQAEMEQDWHRQMRERPNVVSSAIDRSDPKFCPQSRSGQHSTYDSKGQRRCYYCARVIVNGVAQPFQGEAR